MLGGAALYIVGTLIAWRAQSAGRDAGRKGGEWGWGPPVRGRRRRPGARPVFRGADGADHVFGLHASSRCFPRSPRRSATASSRSGHLARDLSGLRRLFAGRIAVVPAAPARTLAPEHRRPAFGAADLPCGRRGSVATARSCCRSMVQTCIHGHALRHGQHDPAGLRPQLWPGRGFPPVVFAMALIASSGSFLNSRIVVRLGHAPDHPRGAAGQHRVDPCDDSPRCCCRWGRSPKFAVYLPFGCRSCSWPAWPDHGQSQRPGD